MKTKFLILLFLLGLSDAIQAVHFKHIGPESGLAHPTVLSICQDSIGRIWFGTNEGLNVYDGNQLISYKPYQNLTASPSFLGEVVKRIVVLSGNELFFMTNKALVKYDIRKETFSTIWEKSRIHSIYSHQGIIWIATSHELYRWDDRNQQLTLHTRLPFEITAEFLIDRQGRKWFASPEGIFRTSDDSHFERITGIPNIESVFESSDGDIWAGSKENGLLRILPNGELLQYNTRNSASKGLHANNVRKITEDRDGNLWFGTFNGLYMFDLQKDLFTSYTREDRIGGITHSSIYPVFIDKNDVLWIGTYFGGVNYASIKKNSFTFYNSSDRQNYLTNPVVGSMCEDSKGNVWICTEGGGLNMLEPESGTIRHFTSSNAPFYLPHTNLKSILYDADKELLYIGSNPNGLYSYDIRHNRFNHEIPGTPDSISSIDEMARYGDRLFFSTKRQIHTYSLKERKASLLYQSPHIASAHIRIDRNKRLWVVEGNQVHLFDVETLKKTTTYDLGDQGIYSRIIRTFQSSKGDHYICTYGNGIMRLDTVSRRFVPFPPQSSPQLSSYCYQMGETPNGNLIITGDKGLTILNEKGELRQSILPEEYFPLNAFMRDCGLFISRNGMVYIGGINGLLTFSETELATPVSYEQPYFSRLYIHERLIQPNDSTGILSEGLPFTKRIVLTHEQNKIEIQFASKSYTSGINPQIYEYKLQGMDKTWYRTTRKSLSYTHLPPGDYLLEVREKGASADTPHATRQLQIVILPPWYATWWAWTLWIFLFLLVAGIGIYIVLARKRLHDSIRKEQMEKQQLKEIDEAKFRFFTSVSHEFRTPLTLIVGQLELLLQEHKIAPSVYTKLTKVTQQAQYLSSLITELIEFRKYEQEQMNIKVAPHSINSYINQVYDSFKELARKQNVGFSVQYCKEDVEVWLDGQQMLKVLYNLLANAFKYTPEEGEIGIGLSVNEQQNLLYIRITDSGVGMNPEELEHIFDRFYQADNQAAANNQHPTGTGIGLALAKSIVEAHKGTIVAKSQTGYGSVFTITLLLGTEHLRADKHIVFEKEQGETHLLFQMPVQPQPAKPATEEEEETEASDDKQYTVVLIEDNAELLEILANLFAPFFNTQTAVNGQEGYELIKQIKPDLVVSDVMMPVMTGTELCSKVKNDLELCHIPVVLLTALNMPQQTIEGLVSGADDYIGKPFNAQVLLARCNNLIRSRKMLYQQFTQKPEAEISIMATNKLDLEFMEKVSAIIDANLTDPEFSIDQLAGEMYMGRSSFYRKFKALTGVSPNDFINSYRLKRAAVMLIEQPEIPISEISDSLGYNTPNYFCRKFKEQFNVAPLKYRQQNRKENEQK